MVGILREMGRMTFFSVPNYAGILTLLSILSYRVCPKRHVWRECWFSKKNIWFESLLLTYHLGTFEYIPTFMSFNFLVCERIIITLLLTSWVIHRIKWDCICTASLQMKDCYSLQALCGSVWCCCIVFSVLSFCLVFCLNTRELQKKFMIL